MSSTLELKCVQITHTPIPRLNLLLLLGWDLNGPQPGINDC